MSAMAHQLHAQRDSVGNTKRGPHSAPPPPPRPDKASTAPQPAEDKKIVQEVGYFSDIIKQTVSNFTSEARRSDPQLMDAFSKVIDIRLRGPRSTEAALVRHIGRKLVEFIGENIDHCLERADLLEYHQDLIEEVAQFAEPLMKEKFQNQLLKCFEMADSITLLLASQGGGWYFDVLSHINYAPDTTDELQSTMTTFPALVKGKVLVRRPQNMEGDVEQDEIQAQPPSRTFERMGVGTMSSNQTQDQHTGDVPSKKKRNWKNKLLGTDAATLVSPGGYSSSSPGVAGVEVQRHKAQAELQNSLSIGKGRKPVSSGPNGAGPAVGSASHTVGQSNPPKGNLDANQQGSNGGKSQSRRPGETNPGFPKLDKHVDETDDILAVLDVVINLLVGLRNRVGRRKGIPEIHLLDDRVSLEP